MTTSSHRLREIIAEVVAAAHPRPVALEELYAAAESRVTFDAEDLLPPMLHGERISEPSWKRNVRNVLQQAKRGGTLVNIQHNAWRLPSPDPATHLDVIGAWAEIHRAAEKALAHGTEFRSTKQLHRYRIFAVHPTRITIQRLDSPAPETLRANEVTAAARYLNAAGGRLGRRAMSYTVAKEVSIVFLHPRLKWSDDQDWIEVLGVTEAEPVMPVYRDFGEAPDDDPTHLAMFARRVRRGQPKFRSNLMGLYGGRCAITGWGPESVLEAAHILVHARTGLNRNENGLLLRSDLHDLFDDGLLRIEPESLCVVLDPSLADTPYWELHGTALRPRIDGSQASREYLRSRWDSGGQAPD